jgi:nicotinate-nucleotide adenylyltransferase
MKKKVGLYGGSFDPPHYGHLNLAFEMLEKHHLDEIWFVPAAVSPHKQESVMTPAGDRLKMVQLAVASIPQFKVLDVEVRRDGPSYTIDTVKDLLRSEKEVEFWLIIGDDNIRAFHTWHRVAELVEIIPLLIGTRSSRCQFDEDEKHSPLSAVIRKGCIETSIMEISATKIRSRVENKLYCRHLIPGEVLDYYIHLNQD